MALATSVGIGLGGRHHGRVWIAAFAASTISAALVIDRGRRKRSGAHRTDAGLPPSTALAVVVSAVGGMIVPLIAAATPILGAAEYRERRLHSNRGPLRVLWQTNHPGTAAIASGIVALASSIVLATFLSRQRADALWAYPLPPMPIAVAGLLSFSVLNAAVEELVWRSALPGLCRHVGWGTPMTLTISSASFGAAHFAGVPWGFLGCGLALTFGLCLSLGVDHRLGMRYAFLAHVGVDLVVGAWLLR